MSVIPPRAFQTDDERRLASTINELSDKMLRAVDAACRLRTAPGDAKRLRGYMRKALEDAGSHAMGAYAYAHNPTPDAEE